MLRGKLAVITGANRGIGLATLKEFAQNGADIIACIRTKDDETEKLFTRISERYSVSIESLTMDLTIEESVKATAKKIISGKRCDIIVNCAGDVHGALVQMSRVEDVRRIFEVNYFGQVLFTQQLLRIMARQKSGAIINVASTAGIEGAEGNIAYGTSKASLMLFTKTLAAEMAQYNVRVNAVAPGLVETDMLQKNKKEGIDAFLSKSVMHRAAKPEEIANVILFLASEMSSFITAQTIRADGGLL